MRLASRTGLLATALAIGLIAASAASADPSHSGWNPTPHWVVRPNPDHQSAELARPAAAHTYSSIRVVRPNPDAQLPQVTSSRGSSAQTATPSLSTTRATTSAGSQGFQFDDAAIGAAAITGLGLLGLAGTFTVRRRNQLLHQ